MKRKVGRWIISFLAYGFFVALIPGAAWLFLGFLVDISEWFMDLSRGIKISVYVVAVICLQLWNPIKWHEDIQKKINL